MPLNIVVEEPNIKTKSFILHGQLDTNTSEVLSESLKENLNDSINILVFDLKNLDFISSAGLRVIFMSEKTMKKNDGQMFMINLQPQVRKVFQIVAGSAVPINSIVKDANELDEYLAGIQEKVLQGDMD